MLVASALATGTVVVGLQGCSISSSTSTSAPGEDHRSSASIEQALIAAYDAVILAHPSLTGALRPIRDEHKAHLSACGVHGSTAPAVTATSTARAAISALITAEISAARAHSRAAHQAADSHWVRTLTFLAASEASHVPALRTVRELETR